MNTLRAARSIAMLAAALAVGAATMAGAQSPLIRGWGTGGRLVFDEIPGAREYRIERAPRPGLAWTATGEIAWPSGSGSVSIDVSFPAGAMAVFRVAAVTNTPTSGGMVALAAATFTMGDTLGEGDNDEWPNHSVAVSAFRMDQYAVTKALWDGVYAWATNHGYVFAGAGAGKAASHPVHSVSWYDCAKWCNARSEQAGLTPCYSVAGGVYRTGQNDPVCTWTATGYRLPTEAEWEMAARGGLSGRRFPWGDTITHDRANYVSDAIYGYDVSKTRGYHPLHNDGVMPYTNPVGIFPPNGYGLYGLAGNQWEWCWDWHGSYGAASAANPTGPSTGDYRVMRGGSWAESASYARVASRVGGLPFMPDDRAGFRCVRR